jgi:hypothetical protein
LAALAGQQRIEKNAMERLRGSGSIIAVAGGGGGGGGEGFRRNFSPRFIIMTMRSAIIFCSRNLVCIHQKGNKINYFITISGPKFSSDGLQDFASTFAPFAPCEPAPPSFLASSALGFLQMYVEFQENICGAEHIAPQFIYTIYIRRASSSTTCRISN